MVDTNTCGRLFISYSRKNKAQVYPLADALAKTGIDIWIDRAEIDPLDDFPARIRDGLARSHALLAWYSPEYAQSSYCQKELTAAWICTQHLTRDVLSRIFIVNPEEDVAHIALGDVGRQNYLAAPKNVASLAPFIQSIRDKLARLSSNFSALNEFKKLAWHPASQPGSSRFVGRLWELWRIHTALNPVGISDQENSNVIVQLTGLGGIGKSLLAIEYAKRFGMAYPGGVYWLRAYGFDPQKPLDSEAQEHERQRQIEDLARLHDIPILDKDFREVRRDLGKKLAAGEPYLWIADDLSPALDQMQGFPGWCAPSGNGHTLITTCSKEYAGLGITVEIDVLDPAAALELLTQKRKPQTKQDLQDAEALADDLGRYALALDVAGYFLLKTMGFAALRDQLAQVERDPLGELVTGLQGQLPGGHEKSIVATLLLSVRLLGEEGLNLLRLAGELHGSTPIPLRLAQGVFAKTFALDEPTAAGYLARAVNQVETHSLATLALGDAGGDAFSVHTLIHYSMLRGDPARQEASLLRQKLREGAVMALFDLLLSEIIDIRNHARLKLVVAHARHLVSELRTEADVKLSMLLASCFGRLGNYREALTIERKLLPICAQVLGADHPGTLTIRGSIATWTGESGGAREARRLFLELLSDQSRVLGADHPDTLATRANIAVWTGKSGEAREALQLSRELLPDQTRVLGADHPDTLAIRGNIAALTGQTGEAREARRLFLELLSDQTRALDADHSDILITRSNIAIWTGLSGETREALRLSYELLPDQTRVLGADHPNTLALRTNITTLTGKSGEAREALRLSRELLLDQTRVLGADHPDTLITRANIATLTWRTGEAREALRLSRELLLDQTRVLGADHPETESILRWIRFLEGHEHGHPPSDVRRSGVEPHRYASKKIGRNEPCPCGSGLKYKRCHGNKE
ncbi:MAG TPA: tetratricopeptide repeat protein [Methylobacter sp.]|jgi:tetratricopeptide (TPR) repeat protein